MTMMSVGCPEISRFEITLHQPQGVYHAGQHLYGYVTLVLNAPLTLHGLALRFVGGTNTEWMQLIRQGKRNARVMCAGSEIYFNEYVTLFGLKPMEKPEFNLEPVLEPDHYTYPFDFTLPPNVPSSFEAPFGRVRYTVEALVERPWSSNVLCTTQYTVLSCRDLNLEDGAARQQRVDGRGLPGLCSCLNESVVAWLETNKKGYVPGETILLRGEVINNSSHKVKRCMAVFKMEITFSGDIQRGYGNRDYSTTTTSELSILSKGEIPPGETQSWDGEQIQIPALPPSALIHCGIIDILYSVLFSVTMSGKKLSLIKIPVYITIGTVPLRQTTQPRAATAPPSEAGDAPPTYAHYMNTADGTTAGEWKPSYPYFPTTGGSNRI